MKVAGKKWIKATEFKQIKALCDTGVPLGVVQKVMGRSPVVIGFIRKAKDFQEYKKLVKERNEKDRQVREARLAEKTGEAPSPDGVVKLLKRQNLLLHQQNKILIRIDTNLELARKGGRLKLGGRW